MIEYLIKSCISLLVLLVVYHVLLEREKMHRFNRFFLIFSLLFSLSVPLFMFEVASSALSNIQLSNQIERLTIPQQTVYQLPTLPGQESVISKIPEQETEIPFLLIGYIIVASILFIRLLNNLYALVSKIRCNERISLGRSTLVLVKGEKIPHSFFNYIFVNRHAYKSGTIDKTIFTHEKTHARQFHSIDILFVELLKIAFWFNPVFYFYKKAIQLNHEYLADDAVLNGSQSVRTYQNLLLNMQSGKPDTQLASSIRYSITKKRLMMMTKNSNFWIKISKQVVLLPLLALLLIVCSARTANAQDVDSMTLSELLETTSQRIKATDSLTAAEKKALGDFISEMRKELPPPAPRKIIKIAPPPPNQIKKQIPPPPQKTKHIVKFVAPRITYWPDGLKKAEAAVKQSLEAYNQVEATMQNLEMLQKLYKDYQNKIDEVSRIRKKYDDKPLSPPRIRFNVRPIDRIRMQLSENYTAALHEYLKIKSIEKNRAKLELLYKKLKPLYDQWWEIVDKQKIKNLIPPMPQNPDQRIKNS